MKMKLPQHAKKVFSGVIFDVYQWPQKMYDGTTKTFEMIKRPDSVVVLPIMGDHIIMARQEQPNAPPFYSLLGGRVDPGETPLEAARREILEEGGLQSDDWEELYSLIPISKMDWVVHYFIARDCRKIADQNLDAGEKIELFDADIDRFFAICMRDDFSEYEMKMKIMQMKLDPKKKQKFCDRIFKKVKNQL